eukprot:scaffold30875_cov50-Attheya_sp.AAC.4
MEMIVDCPIEDQGKADLYLDDGVTVVADIDDNLNRAAAAIPLAIHIVGRPRSGNEPIQREELLSIKKLTAEGGLSEKQDQSSLHGQVPSLVSWIVVTPLLPKWRPSWDASNICVSCFQRVDISSAASVSFASAA